MKRIYTITLLVVAALIAILYLYPYTEQQRENFSSLPTVPSAPIQMAEPGDESLQIVLNTEVAYEERLAAINRLPKLLNGSQIETLHKLIRTKDVHAAIRNDAVVILSRQSEKPSGIAQELIQMYRDESEDATWRDYCIQHLVTVYDFSPEKDLIEATLFEVAARKADKKNNYSGTALLALKRLAQHNLRVTKNLNELARSATAVYVDDPERAVTAFQIASENQDKSVLPNARQIAADENALMRLRMSAIGVLGELGEQEDILLLERLTKNSDARVKNAAKASLKNKTSIQSDMKS